MGIVRTVEWRLRLPQDEADTRLRAAFEAAGLSPEGPPGAIRGHAKRSLMKNRWAAEVSAVISPTSDGSVVVAKVDMAGDKHFVLLGEVAEAVGEDAYDDQGLAAATERLGKASRLFGRKEIRHLRNTLRASEDVVELGQGTYGSQQGLVVLTTERLFFFEKSMMGSESLEEFPLASVSSLSLAKGMTGETLKIYASGNQAEISSMMHGQADAMVRAFHNVKNAPQSSTRVSDPPPTTSAPDLLDQLERLASLRDKGVLSDAEFEAKKSAILDKM